MFQASLAIIPYKPPITPMEFIESIAKKTGQTTRLSLFKSADVASNKNIKSIEIVVSNFLELPNALFPLHREIDILYKTLPWPTDIKKVVLLTMIVGGRGDIAAAAKVIALMQRMVPSLTFDWILEGLQGHEGDPRSFLHCADHSKIQIREARSKSPDDTPADFLITGPAPHDWDTKNSWSVSEIEKLISQKIQGPIFCFLENGQNVLSGNISWLFEKAMSQAKAAEKPYHFLHDFFLAASGNCFGRLPMGLQEGTGVLLDKSRLEAPLSRGYCCPSYLQQIQDTSLKQDILEAMNTQSEPDYDQYSLNAGYAHWPVSWEKFIDCVAIHEKNKHVVIVLNQHGFKTRPTAQKFQKQIFDEKRLQFLKDRGYGTVIFKAQDEKAVILQQAESTRCLTVIARPSFSSQDLKYLQLASERLLATGDNSAVEAWCARCKLYLYENVNNGAKKYPFVKQQVDLAQTLSPTLSRLLALFAGDPRLDKPFLNQPLNDEKMKEIEQLLNDPDLEEKTLQFCTQITTHHSFEETLEGALKRAVWHYSVSSLITTETETIDKKFQKSILNYLNNPATTSTTFHINNMSKIGNRVREVIEHQ